MTPPPSGERLPLAYFEKRTGALFSAISADGSPAGSWTLTTVRRLPALPLPGLEHLDCYVLTFSAGTTLLQGHYRLECVSDGTAALLFAVPGMGGEMNATVN